MKTEGSHEQIAYIEAKKNYLAIGKRYSALLSQIMKMDPNILRIAEEIMITGDGLSAHDNKFLTTFYKELTSKSRIDKKYYNLLLELKKTRNELDLATRALSARRISYLLRKSGMPPKRTNQGKDIIAATVNNPEIPLIEKLSLPEVLDTNLAENLEKLIVAKEIDYKDGVLFATTKQGKDFIKNLEKNIKHKVNDEYFILGDQNLLKNFHKLDKTNILDFVRMSADKEHIREIERRLEAKDIRLTTSGLEAVNIKGKKYLALLTEELSGQLEKKIKAEQLQKNSLYAKSDPRLQPIRDNLSDLDISMGKHSRLGELAHEATTYQSLLQATKGNYLQAENTFAELLTLQETLSTSFADIKKQLVATIDKKQVNIDRLITLMLAVRFLSVYENRYEKKLVELESLLGMSSTNPNFATGPETLSKLSERYEIGDESEDDTDNLIRNIITSRLATRRALGDETNETLIRFILASPQIKEFKHIILTQRSARKHVVDTLYNNDCLYQGLGDISEILAEITELEIEKKEKLADLVHEMELAHKEFWLARINNNNGRYIETNFADLPEEARTKAKVANRDSVASARKEIRQTLNKYRDAHKKHSDKFAETLRKSLQQISKGGDVSKISTDLKKKYREMSENHDLIMSNMEKDILLLENRLIDFEEKTPKEIEKMLISDIRATI